MRGLKASDLSAIVDFIYNGEANIHQEDLDGSLAIAEELQLKGLTGAQMDDYVLKENVLDLNNLKNIEFINCKTHSGMFESDSSLGNSTNWGNALVPVTRESSIVPVSVNPEIENLEDKIDSMIEEVNDGINNRRCNICGKTT